MLRDARRRSSGFTLVELMTVVCIIAILSMIAIPNFLKYRLRSKASERRMNVAAIFTSEEALKQDGGKYVVLAAVPASATVGTEKIVWEANDYKAAGQIDWVVQGGTYGRYAATTDPGGLGVAVCGWTDLDGDGEYAGDALWQPQIKADGTQGAAAPDAPCDTATDTSAHPPAFTLGAGTSAAEVTTVSDPAVY